MGLGLVGATPGPFLSLPDGFRAPSPGGDASCPGFRGSGPGAGERSRPPPGADPAPLPLPVPPSPPSGLVPAPASSTWSLCSPPGYRFYGAGIPPGAATERGRADSGAGVPAGPGAGVAAASALLLLKPRRGAARRPLDSDPGWRGLREGVCPPASWIDTLTNEHREVVPWTFYLERALSVHRDT